MGGYGSGRRSGTGKTKAEDCLSLDVDQLNRKGVLTEFWRGGWQWSRNGEKFASIKIRGGRNTISLSYRYRQGDAAWQDVDEHVAIVWQLCRFGGQRPYFVCPGICNGNPCARRVGKLYCARRYYLCRHCYRLTHAVRSEDRFDRALRRANKIRVNLGATSGTMQPLAPRPKGMWQRTYDRYLKSVCDAEAIADERLAMSLQRILKADAGHAARRKKSKGFWT